MRKARKFQLVAAALFLVVYWFSWPNDVPTQSGGGRSNVVKSQKKVTSGSWELPERIPQKHRTSVYNNIHVAILGRNQGAELLRLAVDSVLTQAYPSTRLFVWLYDDGSDDAETLAAFKEVCESRGDGAAESLVLDGGGRHGVDTLNFQGSRPHNRGGLRCLRTPERLGPAAAKYVSFRRIASEAGPNDVILVVDGDDELNTSDALNVLNAKYIDAGVWCTYGSYTGKWNDQTKPIEDKDVLSGIAPYRPREELPRNSWRYGHPRSFKAWLVGHLTEADFCAEDGDWLLKATDRGFVYRVLERSGAARVGFIDQPIYKYKYSSTGSTLGSVPVEVRKAHLNHVMDMEPSDPVLLPVHVVLVLWDRLLLLASQLENLRKQAQTVFDATGRIVVVHLVNNNPNTRDQVDSIVKEYCDANGCRGGSTPLEIVVAHEETNWHAFQRFVYVSKLRKLVPLDSVIFVDDDQLWPEGFLLEMQLSYAPKSSSHWYGKMWRANPSKPSSERQVVDYWHPAITMGDIRKRRKPQVTRFQYGGPGGAIYATDFWLLEEQILRLKGDLERFHEFDDLWVSYLMDSALGWDMKRYNGPLPVDAFDDPVWKAKHSEEEAESIRNVATFGKIDKNGKKTFSHAKVDMIAELQEPPFDWVLI